MHDQAGADRAGLAIALRHAGTLVGTLEPYELAAEIVLAALAGVELRGTKAGGICQDSGEAAQALMSEGILGDSRQLLPVERPLVEADGFMLWTDDRWHETFNARRPHQAVQWHTPAERSAELL